MPDFADDWLAFPHAVGVLETLIPLLAERHLPEVCFSGIIPGSDVALDYVNDECGAMAYSRVGSVFPSGTFPQQDSAPARIVLIASTIELGIFRGAPIPENGEAPTAEEQFETTRLQLADMRAMLDAICAYCEARELPVLIGAYEPLGPQGGVVGGSWTATIAAR